MNKEIDMLDDLSKNGIRRYRTQERKKELEKLIEYKSKKREQKLRIRETQLINEKIFYNSLLEKQNNLCQICKGKCKSDKPLVIDHNHNCCTTGNGCKKCRRALLCYSCNLLLGLCHEDINILNSTIDYIKYHNQ